MDLQLLLQIDEELDSSEVAAICFLCRDFVSAKQMEGVSTTDICNSVKLSWENSLDKDKGNCTCIIWQIYFNICWTDCTNFVYCLIIGQNTLLHLVWVLFNLFSSLFSQISNARELFRKLEEKCLLDSSYFLSQLLQTIGRRDLLSRLVADLGQPVETDAKPLLSKYR